MRQTIVNTCRIAAGPIAVWALFVAILTLWPDAPHAPAAGPDHAVQPAGHPADATQTATYSHTGLWIADVQADGTVVYLRQIVRR